eukprot:TRINITY_DN1175_c2_g2_i1.p1 TRINITY_DN1175_c2_g2~~TRINITY_DN1175_c2_g2_i1.p1  ORF type:complete len:263 (-),score=22.56 TRINITY_DN1175_c2_g2_i1:35-823(-)
MTFHTIVLFSLSFYVASGSQVPRSHQSEAHLLPSKNGADPLPKDNPNDNHVIIGHNHSMIPMAPLFYHDRFGKVERRRPAASLIAVVVALIFTLIVAAVYRYLKVWPPKDENIQSEELRSWSSGPFDCFDDIPICCWSCFCPSIRWADSMSMIGRMSFWFAVCLFAGMQMLYARHVAGPPGLLWMIALGIWTYCRHDMRRTFNMNGYGEFSYCVSDCCFYLCCTPCAISQEARHIEKAARADHEAVKPHRPQEQAPTPMEMP